MGNLHRDSGPSSRPLNADKGPLSLGTFPFRPRIDEKCAKIERPIAAIRLRNSAPVNWRRKIDDPRETLGNDGISPTRRPTLFPGAKRG